MKTLVDMANNSFEFGHKYYTSRSKTQDKFFDDTTYLELAYALITVDYSKLREACDDLYSPMSAEEI